MRRRDFIAGLGGAAIGPAVVPWASFAQQQPVIGFMHIASPGPMAHLVAAFRAGLHESGGPTLANIPIEFRWADGNYDRLKGFAEDLVSRRVALVVTGGGEIPALAAKTATSTIPIVFNIGNDPVKAGLVASINKPGGNATGVNILTAEMETKRIGLLHELVPKNAVIGHLINPAYPPSEFIARNVETAAAAMGRTIVLLKAGNDAELDALFVALPERKLGGLLVAADPFFNSHRSQIVLWLARLGIPASYEQREFVTAGGLMSYSTSITEAYRQMGVYAGRILKGEKPADLPVVQASKFELVVNLRTAKTLGLTLPSGLMSIIDEVIE